MVVKIKTDALKHKGRGKKKKGAGSTEKKKLNLRTVSNVEKLAKKLIQEKESLEKQEHEQELFEELHKNLLSAISKSLSDRTGGLATRDVRSVAPVQTRFETVVRGADEGRIGQSIEVEIAREVDRLGTMLDDPAILARSEVDPSMISARRVNALKTLANIRKAREEKKMELLDEVLRAVLEAFKVAAKGLTTPDQYNLILETMRQELEQRISRWEAANER